jgi:peptidyl-prolyl cis-trans isomerase C
VTNQKLLSIAAAIAVASFLLGRFTAPDDLIDEIPRRGEKLASFSGGSIGIDEAREVVPEGASKDHAKAAIEALVRTRVLAGRAEDAELHLSPSFLARYSEELAGLYVAEQFEKPFEKQIPSDDVVKKFFEENEKKLGRAERVRLALVLLQAPKGDVAARAKKRAEALGILAELRRSRGDEYAFGRVAVTRSEDLASRQVGGELPFLSREEVAARLGAEVVAGAFAAKPGSLLEAPIETEQGFEIVKVLGHEAGHDASYAELRDAIKTRLTTERHEKALKEFMDQVWASASVKIDEQALERLVAELAKKGAKQGAGKR